MKKSIVFEDECCSFTPEDSFKAKNTAPMINPDWVDAQYDIEFRFHPWLRALDPHARGDRRGGWIQTYTGRVFWPLDPHPKDFCIEDIAHALSRICRFAGHTKRFYSVAQHSVFVARRCGFVGLMHDFPEAYIGDMARPLKDFMPSFKTVEKRVWQAGAAAFGLPMNIPRWAKWIDNLALVTERRDLLLPTPYLWHESLEAITPDESVIIPLPPAAAERAFLAAYYVLAPAGYTNS